MTEPMTSLPGTEAEPLSREVANDMEWDGESGYVPVDWDARAKALLDGSCQQLYDALLATLGRDRARPDASLRDAVAKERGRLAGLPPPKRWDDRAASEAAIREGLRSLDTIEAALIEGTDPASPEPRLWHGDGDEHTEPECLNPGHFEDPPEPPHPDPELDSIPATPVAGSTIPPLDVERARTTGEPTDG